MTATPPVLYSFRRCPYAMRARLALRSAGVTWEHREVDLRERPIALYAASPKATVPVLVLPATSGSPPRVLDESRAIMQWALEANDPDAWLDSDPARTSAAQALIDMCDGPFKAHLDHYKYATRFPGADALEHRAKASEWLIQLDGLLARDGCLMGTQPALADIAIAPFVRQFAMADRDWFDQQPWPHLIQWLDRFLQSRALRDIMRRFPVWQPGAPALLWDGR